MSAEFAGFAFVVLSAVCFSTKAIFAKLAYAYGADASVVLTLRMACALPFFVASSVGAERANPQRVSPRDAARIVFIGCAGYYLAAWLDFLGLELVSASLERVVLFLYPTLVVLLNYVIYRERPPRGIALALGLSYGGVAVCALAPSGGHIERVSLPGVALVFASALAYAFYLSASQPLIVRYGSRRLTAHVLVVACVCVLVAFVAQRPLADLAQPAPVILLGAATGVVATVIPAFALTAGIARIGASRASIFASLGPVATLLLSWLVLDEVVGPSEVAGCALVLAGVAHMSRNTRTNS